MAEPIERDALPQATVEPGRKRRVPVIWIIPIFAALVAIGIFVQRVLSEGPTITIVFKAAEGIEAGKTFIRYKDVNIGQVSAVELSDDFASVTVTAKIARHASALMVDDAKFWVVAPRIGLGGVSGLSTLLSGNYIGFETGKSATRQHRFTALEVPPAITNQQAGRQFVLQTTNLGSLGVGAPVYFRRLVAGQVIAYDLAKDGRSIQVKVFVNAPFDKFVNAGTRFWNASGIDVSLGADGFDVRTQSLVALIAGGLAFETPPFVQDTQPAPADTAFTLYADEVTAMRQPDRQSARYVLHFSQPLRGLTVGAPVTLHGLAGGTVTAVGLDIDPKTMELRGRVELVAYPERLISLLAKGQAAVGESYLQGGDKRKALIARLVEQRGLRAQLLTGNLLTGQLYVAFDFFPDAPRAKVDWSADPVELPTVPSPLPDLEKRLGSILAKLDALPYAAIGGELKTALASVNKLVQDTDQAIAHIDGNITPELKAAIEAFRAASASADQLLRSTDATLLGKDAPGQQELRNAMQEVTRAARSVRVLTDYLELHPEALLRGKTEEKP